MFIPEFSEFTTVTQLIRERMMVLYAAFDRTEKRSIKILRSHICFLNHIISYNDRNSTNTDYLLTPLNSFNI